MGSVGGRGVAILLAGLSVCADTTAQVKADKPAPKVGDKWTFTLTVNNSLTGDSIREWSRMVTKVDPDRITMVGERGQVLHYDGSLNFIDAKGADYALTYYKFPMSVGNAWSFRSYRGNTNFERTSSYKVTAFEAITVPAGTFDCFRIEGEWETFGKGYYSRGIEKYWYCPGINFIAKRIDDHTLMPSYGQARTHLTQLYELTAFTRRP